MGGTCCVASRKEDQVAKAILWLPWFYVDRFLQAIDYAEDVLGRPPNSIEIYASLNARFSVPVRNCYETAAILLSIYREDMIYTDTVCHQFTRRAKEGYNNFSFHFKNKFPGYKIASDGAVAPATAKVVNYQKLVEMLRSKDESLLEQCRWQFDQEFRFLDGGSLQNNRVCFTSFPRSGNSFLRRTIEQVTGITTGATMSLNTSTSLQIQGLKGEFISDDRVWISKAHHPFNLPGNVTMDSNKIIICVRNPLDVFPSYASLVNTLNHGVKPEFNYETDYAEWWNWWIKKQCAQMRKFFDVLLKHTHEQKLNPLYIVRYEDLVLDPKTTLQGLFSFLLDHDPADMDGTNMAKRIDEFVALGKDAARTYTFKSTTGKFNQNVKLYSPEQIELIKSELGDLLYFLGYTNMEGVDGLEKSETAFFDFEEHSEENKAKFNGFLQVNEASTKEVLAEPKVVKTYGINKGKEIFDLFDAELMSRVQEPGLDWAARKLEKGTELSRPIATDTEEKEEAEAEETKE